MKFIMLIYVKVPTSVGILTSMSMINTSSNRLKARPVFIFSILVLWAVEISCSVHLSMKSLYFHYFSFMSNWNIVLSWVENEKKLYNLEACNHFQTERPSCCGCRAVIHDRWMLHVGNQPYHLSCLRCSVCLFTLDKESSCFIRDGSVYCKFHYTRYDNIIYTVNEKVLCFSFPTLQVHIESGIKWYISKDF